MMPTNNELLEMDRIDKSFPGVQALKEVSFSVRPGEIHALVGENGAGKSTLMKILVGAIRADAGTIRLHGNPVHIDHPRRAQQLGISIIHQELSVLANLTVGQNIYLGREPRRWVPFWIDRQRLKELAQQQLQRVGLALVPDTPLADFSIAQRQMVEVAKALSLHADLIVMDEPTSALTETETENLFRLMRELKSQGIAIVFITHRLEEIFQVSDRVTVLRDGRLIDTVPIGEIDPVKVVHLMVGRDVGELYPKKVAVQEQVVLSVRHLRRGREIRDISFDLHRGEILALAGLVGAGRTFVARAIFGADPIEGGEIQVEGRPVQIRSPQQTIAMGIGLLPEDRKGQGLCLGLNVATNVSLAGLHQVSTAGVIRFRKLRQLAQEFVQKLNIRTPSLSQLVRNLSGGNQQKVVLAKWLSLRPKVLILDEPTRGVDVGAKAEIHALMNQLAQQGVGILMISSELPEVLGVADRILVIHEGAVSGEFTRGEATQDRIMLAATGSEGETLHAA
jgi:ABC-type sugar transport system ATPase subunit